MKRIWIGTRCILILAQSEKHEKDLIALGYPIRVVEVVEEEEFFDRRYKWQTH